MARTRNPWLRVGWEAWSLGLESSAVIGLRSTKLMAGGASGAAEAKRMIAEKVDAGLALQTLAMSGGLGWTPQAVAGKTLAHYRRRVRANRRRLAKG
ncbi:MAG TPA: hypothetical protein VGH86_13435 [Phenylobacterium sp.]